MVTFPAAILGCRGEAPQRGATVLNRQISERKGDRSPTRAGGPGACFPSGRLDREARCGGTHEETGTASPEATIAATLPLEMWIARRFQLGTHKKKPTLALVAKICDGVAQVRCPYCRERIELYVDPDTTGSYVEDCAVCCRPWAVQVEGDDSGERSVEIGPAQ